MISTELKAIIYFLFYRHTEEMIHKLESAGLGYHVETQQTHDRLGKS